LFPLPPPDGFPVVLGAFFNPLDFAIKMRFNYLDYFRFKSFFGFFRLSHYLLGQIAHNICAYIIFPKTPTHPLSNPTPIPNTLCRKSLPNLFAGFLIDRAVFKLPSNIENNIHCPTATALEIIWRSKDFTNLLMSILLGALAHNLQKGRFLSGS